MLTKERVIELLGLTPLAVEGGMYRKTYRSEEVLAKSEGRTNYDVERMTRRLNDLCNEWEKE